MSDRGGRVASLNGWRALMIALVVVIAGGCGGDDGSPAPTATATVTAEPTATPEPSPNLPPVIAPIRDRTVIVGDDVLVAVNATDPEGLPVTVTTSELPLDSYFLPKSNI